MAVAAVASAAPPPPPYGSASPLTSSSSLFYAMDACGDIIVSNSSTRFLKDIRMGIDPRCQQQQQQYITVVGCTTKSNILRPAEADMETVFHDDDVEEEGSGNERRRRRHPCADEWEGFDLLPDYGAAGAPEYNSSSFTSSDVECGTIFEKNFSPQGIFWKGSLSGLMTVSSGKVEDNGPINIIWSSGGKEDDSNSKDEGGCAEAKIYFQPADGAMTLFEVAFMIGHQERLMRVAVLGDKEADVKCNDDDDNGGGDNRDTTINILASILGIIGSAAFLYLIKGYLYMCLVYIVAHTCARRYPI